MYVKGSMQQLYQLFVRHCQLNRVADSKFRTYQLFSCLECTKLIPIDRASYGADFSVLPEIDMGYQEKTRFPLGAPSPPPPLLQMVGRKGNGQLEKEEMWLYYHAGVGK